MSKRDEIQARIGRLKKQVARAEAKGFFDTAHHQMLANYQRMLKPAGGTSAKNAQAGDKEKPNDGE